MKPTFLFIISAFLLFLTSCEADKPDTDMIPPKFSFQITGDGFDHTFNQDTDFENLQLNLKNGVEYEFIFTGSDNEGLKDLILSFPGGLDLLTFLDLPEDMLPGWFETSRYGDYQTDGVRFKGNDHHPVSETLLHGKLRIGSGQEEAPYHFQFLARDYGGLNGVENTSWGRLFVLVKWGGPTELVPRGPIK